MLDTLQIEELAIAMKQWRGEDYLVYATLDCIYACKPRHWRPMGAGGGVTRSHGS